MNPARNNQPFVFSSAATAAVTAGGMAVASPQTASLVNDTRREISEIVREVATEARGERPLSEFFALLADRVLRAMAAEGVMVWRRNTDQDGHVFEPLSRLGRITDQSIPTESTSAHQLMLAEIATQGQPVVVPPTPGATDSAVPANPTDVPAAVVPIESDALASKTDYLIEVFLEPEGGVATQRGYLRFVAQMADLAGEYLRSEQLRYLRRTQTVSRRVDQAIQRIHQNTDRRKVEAAIVDCAADVFGFDRVGLCLIDSPHTTLAAVSHINKIDQRSIGAQQLRAAADADLIEQFALFGNEKTEPVGVVVAPENTNAMRLVAIGSIDESIENQNELRRFVQHAYVALRNASQFDFIPGGRLIAALAPALQASRIRWWMRPIFTSCVLTMLIIAVMFPVPMYVTSPATLHPSNVQRLTAPRDAIVKTIHVDHGQHVILDEPLLTLHDPHLDQQITNLIGRRAVLVQKQTRWNEMLVDIDSHRRDQTSQLQGEQSLVIEEISAIDSELGQLRQSQASLVLRADRTGIVNAWRLRERLDGRPLRRGDPVAQVIADQTDWVADVRVPQNRIDHIQDAANTGSLKTQVALDATPSTRLDAGLQKIGPALPMDATGISATSIQLRMSDAAVKQLIHETSPTLPSAAPAHATFHCGQKPAGYLLFQDVIRSAQATLGLYFGNNDHRNPS